MLDVQLCIDFPGLSYWGKQAQVEAPYDWCSYLVPPLCNLERAFDVVSFHSIPSDARICQLCQLVLLLRVGPEEVAAVGGQLRLRFHHLVFGWRGALDGQLHRVRRLKFFMFNDRNKK